MKKYLWESYYNPQSYCKKRLKRKLESDGSNSYISVIEYDRHGEEVNKEKRVDRIYDEKGNMIKESYYICGQLSWEKEKKYNERGKLKEYIRKVFKAEGNELYHSKYDDYGNEIYVHQIIPEDQNDTFKEFTEYYYGKEIEKIKKEDVGYNFNQIAKIKRYEQGPEGDKLVLKGEYEYGKARRMDKEYREERFYFGALKRLIKENMIKNKEEKKKILEVLKTKLKWFIGTGEDYSEEKIKLQKLKYVNFMWREEAEEYINKEPERVIKIRQLVVPPKKNIWDINEKWRKEEHEGELWYLMDEGFKIIKEKDEIREEITIVHTYEYDVEKEKIGRYVEERVDKQAYNMKGEEIESVYITDEGNCHIDKSIYDKMGRLLKEVSEERKYDKEERKIGRRKWLMEERFKYNERGQLMKKESYEIFGKREKLLEEEIYNEKGDLLEKRERKGKDIIKVMTTMEQYSKKRKRNTVIRVKVGEDKKGNNQRIEIVEEDEDKDPRVIYTLDMGSGEKTITEFEYYKDEYYEKQER